MSRSLAQLVLLLCACSAAAAAKAVPGPGNVVPASAIEAMSTVDAARTDATFSSAFVTTKDGARIHYLEGGKTDGQPTVVFVPGWTWPASVWDAQMTSLASSHRVVAMDPRSQGKSSKTADGNTPETRAEDLGVLLAHLGGGPVVLVGWSQGVQDVAAYIDTFGTGRLAGVVLVDAAFSEGSASIESDPKATRQLLERMALYSRHPKDYLGGMMDASRVHPFTASEKDRWVALAQETPTSTGIAMLVSDLLTRDRRAVAGKIDKPVLAFASSSSGNLESVRKMVDDIPKATLIVMDNAGHAVFLDQPTDFSSALAKFVDDLNMGKK